ncbi:MAG TPA: FAD-dependent oxidoreductase [Candidatus Fournierella merdigallinarum]|nr:FAD-dependent oxidoreductase [Candidatus Fournierella merdigallinarum]
MSEKILDCAVVGGGPAGLSAAINLHQRGKTVRVLGAAPGLLAKAERVDNYLGLPGLSGSEMLAAFTGHAKALGIEAEPGRVANIMPMDERLMLNFDGDILEARAVILAGGVAKAKPVAGESEFLGRGVSYCATCDGMLYRGRQVAVWGLSPEAAGEANFLASIGCKVRFVSPRRPPELDSAIEHIPGAVQAVGGGDTVEWVRVAGEELAVQGVFVLRSAIAPDTLLPGLAIQDGFVQVDRRMATNIPGVFAAGDITGAPLQVAKAVGEGLIAGLSAAEYLDKA